MLVHNAARSSNREAAARKIFFTSDRFAFAGSDGIRSVRQGNFPIIPKIDDHLHSPGKPVHMPWWMIV